MCERGFYGCNSASEAGCECRCIRNDLRRRYCHYRRARNRRDASLYVSLVSLLRIECDRCHFSYRITIDNNNISSNGNGFKWLCRDGFRRDSCAPRTGVERRRYSEPANLPGIECENRRCPNGRHSTLYYTMDSHNGTRFSDSSIAARL